MKIPYRGGAVSLILLLILATPPAELLEQAGAYSDTRGDIRSVDAVPIDVFGGLVNDPSRTIPKELGEWSGDDDDSWPPELQNVLDYDSLLVRHYVRPGFYTPVQLMVISAKNAEKFHDPTACFRFQGAAVKVLEPTSISYAGNEHPVGRMIVDEAGQPTRVVYNIYLVQQKFAATERTTWLRLTFYGANETTEPQLEPYLTSLMEDIAPHAFASRGGPRTTFEAIGNGAGIGWAAGAVALAMAPMAIDVLVKAVRKRP